MKKILLAAIFLFVAGFGSTGTSQSSAIFTGYVYDYYIGPSEPLIGASVVAMNESTGRLYGAITDLDGYFSLSVPSGRYWVSFSYIGYTSEIFDNIPAVVGVPHRFHIGMISEPFLE